MPASKVLSDWETQITLLKGSLDLPRTVKRHEQDLRVRQLAETFFGLRMEIKFLRDYRHRDLILEMGEVLERRLRDILNDEDFSQESLTLVNIVGDEFLKTYAEVAGSDEFAYWRAMMRQRSYFWGFMISPGAIYLSYLASELALGLGKTFDFLFYFTPKTLTRWGYLGTLKATEIIAKRSQREVLAEKCRGRIRRIHEAREAEVTRFKRDLERHLDRFVHRWKTSLRPSRLVLYGATGSLISYGLFHYPIPMLTELSFEQQKKWDAQEESMEDRLIEFFRKTKAQQIGYE